MSEPGDNIEWKMYRGFEGGAIYTGESDGKFLVRINEAAMADLLPEDERGDFQFDRIESFPTREERDAYLARRYPTR